MPINQTWHNKHKCSISAALQLGAQIPKRAQKSPKTRSYCGFEAFYYLRAVNYRIKYNVNPSIIPTIDKSF